MGWNNIPIGGLPGMFGGAMDSGGGMFKNSQPTGDFWDKLLQALPQLGNLGAGMLANNTPGASFGQTLGGGMQYANQQQAQRQQQAIQEALFGMRQQEFDEEKKRRAAEDERAAAKQRGYDKMLEPQGGYGLPGGTTSAFGPLTPLLAGMEPDKGYSSMFDLMTRKPDKPEGFTLNEGDIRYDAAGNVLAKGAPKTFAPERPSKPSDTEMRINLFMARGMTRQQAEDLALGMVRPTTDEYGRPGATNLATNQFNPSSLSGGQALVLPKAARGNFATQNALIDQVLAERPLIEQAIDKGVGALPKIVGGITGPLEQLGLKDINVGGVSLGGNPDVVAARTRLDELEKTLIDARDKTDNRTLKREYDDAAALADVSGWGESPGTARAKLNELYSKLERIKVYNETQLSGGTVSSGAPVVSSKQQYDALRPGDEYIEVNAQGKRHKFRK